ncbi:MAG TPA: keto-deoxy-phosphogluconate aldolase [Xanthomonadales bacterium]|nr:keto-deoxy-phosphogluconate aldolase [Xanthomonadales bacterium]
MSQWTPDSRADAVDAFLEHAPVLPVLAIQRLDDAVPLARALVAGGLPVLEVTLRGPFALAAIAAIRSAVPEAVIGVGTVLRSTDLHAAIEAGARFAIAPGATEALYAAAAGAVIPFIPAVATASELMRGLELGYRRFKFFPARSAGGTDALRSLAGPFPQARFCPTGGIDAERAADYLKLPNVPCVGGSWIAAKPMISAADWRVIESNARRASALKSR